MLGVPAKWILTDHIAACECGQDLNRAVVGQHPILDQCSEAKHGEHDSKREACCVRRNLLGAFGEGVVDLCFELRDGDAAVPLPERDDGEAEVLQHLADDERVSAEKQEYVACGPDGDIGESRR